MRPRIPRILAGGLAAAAITAAVGGAAFAQTPSPTPGAGPPAAVQQRAQDFLNALAGKLGKTPAEVQAAFKAVEHDRVVQDVKDGKLTQQQADQINQRIDQGNGLPFFGGRGFGGPGFDHRGGHGFGVGDPNGLAQFLGVQPQDLMQALRSGKSLAQVAQDHGKSRDDLKNYLTTQEKDRLAQAVQAGRLTQQQADQMLQNLSSRLDQMIDRTGGAGRGPGEFGERGFGGPGGGRFGPRGIGNGAPLARQ